VLRAGQMAPTFSNGTGPTRPINSGDWAAGSAVPH
jgi:hypothetical protein